MGIAFLGALWFNAYIETAALLSALPKDITMITMNDLTVGNVYNLNGTVLIVRSVDTKVCYVVGNNAWQGQYVTVTQAQFLKHIEGAVRVV